MYLRRNVQGYSPSSSLEFLSQHGRPQTPNWIKFTLIFLIGGQTGSLAYFVFVGLTPFLKAHAIIFDPQLISVPLFVASCVCVLIGKLSQKVNPSFLVKSGLFCSGIVFPLSIVLCIKGVISLWPLFLLIGSSIGNHGALQHALFQNLVKIESRQRFISLAFSLGTGFLTTLSLLATQNHQMMSLALFSLVSLSALSLYLYEERKNGSLYQNTEQVLYRDPFLIQAAS